MSETIESTEQLEQEDYMKAMNLIGQGLYNGLIEAINDLPDPIRETNVVLQGMSGFLANMVYQQSPTDFAECQKMLEHINQITLHHLKEMCKIS